MAGSLSSLPSKFFCIDVECIATGPRHDARAVALIAIVDKDEKVVFHQTIKQDGFVFNYLTPLTNLRKGDLNYGVPLDVAVREIKKLLGPGVVLVGQGIDNDIQLLNLQMGVDFEKSVDLAELFKTYNHRYGHINYFALSHEANTLLRQGMITDTHDPITDAVASIQLFKKYYADPAALLQAKQKLLWTRPPMSWRKRNNWQWEGVCMAAFMPSKCSCGAPTFRKD